MAGSLRSSRLKKNNTALRDRVFRPVHSARVERLSKKQNAVVPQKSSKRAEKTKMDVDSKKPKSNLLSVATNIQTSVAAEEQLKSELTEAVESERPEGTLEWSHSATSGHHSDDEEGAEQISFDSLHHALGLVSHLYVSSRNGDIVFNIDHSGEGIGAAEDEPTDDLYLALGLAENPYFDIHDLSFRLPHSLMN
jgi:hypothetical protein